MDGNWYDTYYRILVLFGLFILLFGLVSLYVKERLYLAESLLAVAFGIAFGPLWIDVIDPQRWFDEPTFWRVLMEFSRIVMSLQVMAVGLCTPISYVRKGLKSLLVILGPVMICSWIATSCIVKYVLQLDWYEALIIGACLSPTDPVLASAVVKGKFANRYIPSNLRNLLSVESGANDGLGFPLLMLPVLLSQHTTKEALYEWIVSAWGHEVLLSIIVGFILGYLAKFLLEKSQKHRLIDHESFLAYALTLSLSISGMVALISSDDLLSVFIAGNVFAYDDKFHQATKDAHFQEVLDMLFNISFFIFLGSIFPWKSFAAIGIQDLCLLAGLILVFRRLPFVLMFKKFIPELYSTSEALFCGWLGPMGVGAIFFAMVARNKLDVEMSNRVFTVVTFVVLSSIVVHGITVPISYLHLKRKARIRKRKELNKLKAAEDLEEGYTTYEQDPYAETIDLTGASPEAVRQKLQGMT